MISIALGMDPNFRYLVGDPMSAKRAMRITQKCKDSSAIPFSTTNDLIQEGWLEQLSENGEREVEIFGAYEEMCVSSAVRHATDIGLSTLIPKNYIVRSSRKSKRLISSLEESNRNHLIPVPFEYCQDKDYYYIKPSNELQASSLS